MAPTLISSTPFSTTTDTATAITSASVAVQSGDVLEVKVCSEDSGNVPATPTNTGTAPSRAWREDATTGVVANHEYAKIYTAIAGASENITVSVNASGTASKAAVLNVWRNAQVASTPATNSTKSGASGAPQASLTTVAPDSVVSWVSGDWNTTSGAITYLTTSATPTSEGQVLAGGNMEASFARQAAVTAGVQNFGKTAPTGQAWVLLGIEIQSAAVARSAPDDVRRRRLRPLLVR